MKGNGRSERPVRVVIVGGGITGLVTAFFLGRTGFGGAVTVLEASDRLGGNIRTERTDGFILDAGPDSFLNTKPDAVELCRALRLEGELVTTREEARRVYVARNHRLWEMPGGMSLAVPTRVGPILRTPLLSLSGKVRMLLEPFIGAPSPYPEDESIESFLYRRIGREATARLAAPLLAGVHAGDAAQLSMPATFPQLVELERRHGSLMKGLAASHASRGAGEPNRLADFLAWLRRGGAAQPPSPFSSLRGGLGRLVDALRAALPEGTVQTNAAVSAVHRSVGSAPWAVELRKGDRIDADAVVLAVPARAAASVVPDPGLAAELSAVPYVSTATVFFGFDRRHVSHDLRGFGFIVPRGEAEILAATWVSSKWGGRAPEGRVLMRAFVGGQRLEETDDEALVVHAQAQLVRLMGSLGSPLFTRVFRYTQRSPQPVVGHLARMERVRERLRKLPGLYLVGAGYEGVGIPDCVRQARQVAEQLSGE